MAQMQFERAGIPIQSEADFLQLRDAIERVFGPELAAKFLKRLDRAGIPVRRFEAMLAGGYLEKVDPVLGRGGRTAQQIYDALSTSDQAQVREFYLQRLEQVGDELRSKFRKIYYCN